MWRDVVASNQYGKNSRDYEKWDLKLLSTLAKAADTQNSVIKDGVRAIVKGVEM